LAFAILVTKRSNSESGAQARDKKTDLKKSIDLFDFFHQFCIFFVNPKQIKPTPICLLQPSDSRTIHYIYFKKPMFSRNRNLTNTNQSPHIRTLPTQQALQDRMQVRSPLALYTRYERNPADPPTPRSSSLGNRFKNKAFQIQETPVNALKGHGVPNNDYQINNEYYPEDATGRLGQPIASPKISSHPNIPRSPYHQPKKAIKSDTQLPSILTENDGKAES
jgi:hypothetical protein